MHDPFAALDPMNKPKVLAMPSSGPVGGNCAILSPTNSQYQTTPMGMGMPYSQSYAPPPMNSTGPMTMPPPAPGGMPVSPYMMQANPFGTHQPLTSPMSNGAAFMTQPSTPSYGGHGMPTTPVGSPFHTPQPPATNEPIMYDSIKQLFQPQAAPVPGNNAKVPVMSHPNDPFSSSFNAPVSTSPSLFDCTRGAEPTPSFSQPEPRISQPQPQLQLSTGNGAHQSNPSSSIVTDFDPFSPRDGTPATPFDFEAHRHEPITPQPSSTPLAARRMNGRQTQEEQRAHLSFSSNAFQQAATGSPKVSLKSLSIQDPTMSPAASSSFSGSSPSTSSPPVRQDVDDSDYFMEGTTTAQDAFGSQAYGHVDDVNENEATGDWGHVQRQQKNQDDLVEQCDAEEYDVTFDSGRKLGVLMERMDIWGNANDRRQEVAVVKLVVENGAADRVGVTVGSSVVGINHKSVANEPYVTILEIIKSTPRPMSVRFKRATVNRDTTQGNVLTRISNGTFSVGNFTSGNASWTDRYFAFGGAKMDVLQLFVSRAAYHECVISLYEKRVVHTQIQSFRLCRDHKISPIKSKIYKGYGNLHYFSLSVPSLRFVAAKFACEDYDTLKNLWSHTFDAIERKKRMG